MGIKETSLLLKIPTSLIQDKPSIASLQTIYFLLYLRSLVASSTVGPAGNLDCKIDLLELKKISLNMKRKAALRTD